MEVNSDTPVLRPRQATASFPADHRRARLHGHVAFVTGGTRGIGAAISRSFAEQGAIVAAGYSRDAERAAELRDQLRDHGVDTTIHQGQRRLGRGLPAHRLGSDRGPWPARHPRQQRRDHDRQDRAEDDRRRLVQGDRGEPLGGVLHVPGGAAPHDRARVWADHQHLVDHRRDGQHRPGQLRRRRSQGCRGSRRRWRARRPSSCHGPASSPRTGSGSPSTRSRPASSRPRCCESVPDKVLDKIRSQIPVGRLGRPDEIARAVHFLIADKSSYITGQTLSVNGGMDM